MMLKISKTKFTKHLKSKTIWDKKLSRQKRGAAMLGFGALTSVTAGAVIASSQGSIFGSCGGTDQNREDVDFVLTQRKK